MKNTCMICPRHCVLAPGQTGFCKARQGTADGVVCSSYGLLTSLALDPIEKKPLRRFFPGSLILSAGSFGCNLRCPHCQNHTISMADASGADTLFYPPEDLAEKAASLRYRGNIGLACTYNEPLIGYEYVRDCAAAVRDRGMKNVLVTNGYVCQGPLERLLPLIDAMNIDLKAFSEDFYREIGGELSTVKDTIALASETCHVEVTALIIPGRNDSPEEMESLAGWLASVDRNIPLHVARFFPCYLAKDLPPTPVSSVRSLAGIAGQYLSHVYMGNC